MSDKPVYYDFDADNQPPEDAEDGLMELLEEIDRRDEADPSRLMTIEQMERAWKAGIRIK